MLFLIGINHTYAEISPVSYDKKKHQEAVKADIKELNRYISSKPKSNAIESTIWTASKLNDVNGVVEYIKQGINIDAKDENGNTALFYASVKGYDALLKQLITLQADIHTVNHFGWTPLIASAFQGHHKNITLLLNAKADVTAKTKEGYTSLMLASRYGHIDAVKQLTSNKASINMVREKDSKRGITALMLAVKHKRDDVIHWLVEQGADKSIKDKSGNTAIFYAVKYNNFKAIDLLIKNGMSINTVDDKKRSMLHIAAAYNETYWVEWLINQRINTKLKDASGFIALDSAVQFAKKENLRILLAVSTKHEINQALLTAAKVGVSHIIPTLLKANAAIDTHNTQGETALIIAVQNRHRHFAEKLLEHNADIDRRNLKGRTALLESVATSPLNIKIIQLLLDSGADTNLKDNHGSTALSLLHKNHSENDDLVDIARMFKS